MHRGMCPKLVLAAAVCASLAAPQLASAAGPDYYTSPSAGLNFECSPTNRCSVTAAASQALAGERILVSPGTHLLTGDMSLQASLMPEVAGTRPVLTSNIDYTVTVAGANSVVRDLRIDISGVQPASYALNLFSPTSKAERVEVFATGASSPFAAAVQGGASISDSVLHASGTFAVAVASGGTGSLLRNVTAIATGPSSTGLFTNPSYQGAAPVQTITAQNSIFRGDNYGIDVQGDGSHTVSVETDHSITSDLNRAILPDATISGDPQTPTPLFVGGTDFHQLAGSPTVNAGAAVPGLSATDLDGQARTVGAAPDIGADEYVPPDPPAAPQSPSSKKKKCKKGKKRKGKAAAKKKCKKKKRKKR